MKRYPVHPFLIALFPPLALFMANRDEVAFRDVILPILVILLVTGFVYFLLAKWLRKPEKAALITSLNVFLFLSFRSMLWGISVATAPFVTREDRQVFFETRLAYILWFAFCILLSGWVIWKIWKNQKNFQKLTYGLNVIGCILLLTTAFRLFIPEIQTIQNVKEPEISIDWFPSLPTQVIEKSSSYPDIYYIILDGYAREDILAAYYDYNNNAFISSLKNRGFYIADEAHSNYNRTPLSIGSSLNWDYLDSIAEHASNENIAITQLKPLIENNRTFSILRNMGYEIVSFSSDFWFTDISTLDLKVSIDSQVTSYENLLISNTPLSIFLLGEQYTWHRNQIDFTLDHLTTIEVEKQPKFVFAHILAPHPPFVFNEMGEAIFPDRQYSINDGNDFFITGDSEEYIRGYVGQLQYINKRILTVLDQIMANSDQAPIIILQADHGPGLLFDHNNFEKTNQMERMSIFSAYYLPENCETKLYPSITPVNSFRSIFNLCFNANYPFLEDRSFYSSADQVLKFIDVTDQLRVSQ